MTLGVAIIGAGLIGGKRAASLPTASRSAPSSTRIAIARRSSRRCIPGAVAADSLEQALDDPDVGLVIVATPHNQLAAHRDRSRCVAATTCLLEKPGAHRLDALLELQQAAADAERRVRVGFNHRFHPSFLRAREIVAIRRRTATCSRSAPATDTVGAWATRRNGARSARSRAAAS